MTTCQNCGFEASEVYCSHCGQPLTAKRITVHHMLHEVAHTFWHLEKGFLYTLKELALHPGSVQRKYLSGLRLHFQKPFPLYAISISFFALALYLINLNATDQSYQYFYKHYFFLVQTSMLPFYALITYLLFYNTRLNYAEALVMNVYMLGFTLVIIVPINLLSYFFPNIVISVIEVLFLLTYNMFTYVNFFKEKKAWWVIIKSFISIVVGYLLFQVISNFVMEWFMH